jgi:hypothetical protein
MSRQGNFTDDSSPEQETAKLRVVWRPDAPRRAESGAFKTAFRDFQDDLERARDTLRDAVESVDYSACLFAYADEQPKDGDRISIDWRSFDALKARRDDAGESITAAFRNFDWELRRASRAFKEAIAREKAEG